MDAYKPFYSINFPSTNFIFPLLVCFLSTINKLIAAIGPTLPINIIPNYFSLSFVLSPERMTTLC